MATTAASTPPAPAAAGRHVGAATQLGRVMAAEWTKLRSVRSTVWTMAMTLVLSIGLPALFALAVINASPQGDFEAASFSMSGLFLGQLVIGSLGVLVVTAEYSSGTIRASLSAVPQRDRLLVGKALTFVLALLVVSLVACFAAFFLTQAILNTHALGVSLGDRGSVQVVVGGALYLTVVGLLGLGLGFMLRHTAGAISTVFGLLFVLPILASFLPASWQLHVVKYLPAQAGGAIFSTNPSPDTLAPWTGLALFFGYALLSVALGAWVLNRRDA